jgi:predicted dehydrogenase
MTDTEATAPAHFRVGIIGCGDVAQRYHAPAFAAQPDVTIVGCASRTLESAQALARRYDAAAYPSTEALIGQANPDLVVVTTHEAARLEPLELVLREGLHLFVEKPLYARVDQDRITAEDYRAARAALKLWDRSRSTFGVNFNYRMMPHMQRMKSDIVDGSLGEILSVNASTHLACWSHTIDLLQWWLGAIQTVSALRSELSDQLDRVCTVSFVGGAIGTLAGASGTFERTALLHIEVRGSRARGIVEGVNGSYRRVHESSDARIDQWPNPDVTGDCYSSSFRTSIDGYCDALRAGSLPPVSGDDGLSEMAVEAAVDRSASTGTVVRVDSL